MVKYPDTSTQWTKKGKKTEHERCQRHWTFEQYEFSSLGREFYLSVFLTLTPSSLAPLHAPIFCLMPGLLF